MTRARWAVATMAVAALGVGGLANVVDDRYLASGWHTTVHGVEGEDVVGGTFQVHVHGATAAQALADDEPVPSAGWYVVVDLSYATTDEWSTPEEVVLVDRDGREFTHPGGFGSTGAPWLAGPDIWFRGTLLFEVPEDALESLSLVVRGERPRPILPGTVVRVPLTVTTTAEPLVVERGSLLPRRER